MNSRLSFKTESMGNNMTPVCLHKNIVRLRVKDPLGLCEIVEARATTSSS